MRNVFDQYDQPENRLTHALVCTLGRDRRLLRPFLKWLGIGDVPPTRKLRIVEQHVPGTEEPADESEARGLPDACIFDEGNWALVVESKVQAHLQADQVRRHLATVSAHGFEQVQGLVISVDDVTGPLPNGARAVKWQEVYCWFDRQAAGSGWAREFVEYMQVFEARMIAKDYEIRGTLTVFNGLKFDKDNPYTYREGKRLIRLLGDELQARKDLHRIGVDPKGERRPAITGRSADSVWDFLPLEEARGAKLFTEFPHFTLSLRRANVRAVVIVPNGVRGGFRGKLRQMGETAFREFIESLEKNVRPVVRKAGDACPKIYLQQRHFRSQKSRGEIDAQIEADLRTLARSRNSRVKYQPQWIDAIYDLLVHKRSNMQLGVGVDFQYDCPIVRSPEAVDLFAETWIALSPLVDLVLDGRCSAV